MGSLNTVQNYYYYYSQWIWACLHTRPTHIVCKISTPWGALQPGATLKDAHFANPTKMALTSYREPFNTWVKRNNEDEMLCFKNVLLLYGESNSQFQHL